MKSYNLGAAFYSDPFPTIRLQTIYGSLSVQCWVITNLVQTYPFCLPIRCLRPNMPIASLGLDAFSAHIPLFPTCARPHLGASHGDLPKPATALGIRLNLPLTLQFSFATY